MTFWIWINHKLRYFFNFFTAIKCIYQPLWAFLQTKMADFPILSYISTPEIPTLSNSGKLSWWKFHNCLAYEVTAHYTCKNAEMNLKSTTANGFNFRIINSEWNLGRGGGVRLSWLDCKVLTVLLVWVKNL